MSKNHWPSSDKTEPLALGPGGSAGSVQVPVTLCGTYGYGVEYAVHLGKVNCKSCMKTNLFKKQVSVVRAIQIKTS